MTIPTYLGEVPSVTMEQMIEVGWAMLEDVRIELIRMRDNAGRNLAHLARMRFLVLLPLNSLLREIVVYLSISGAAAIALICVASCCKTLRSSGG